MFSSTLSLATHLYSSLQGAQAARRVVEYVLYYSGMAARKINYDTKHLMKGDPLPPFNGKLRVYSMRLCPFAQRTILALNAKNLDYEVVNIDLWDKPDWLASKSPFSKVPALEIADGVTIYESLVTVQYLDDVYPDRPLLPKDPVLKAKDKILCEAIGPITSLFIKELKAPDRINDEVIASYFKALDFLQNELKQRGTKFFDGEQPGYADYMTWPWFERILTFDKQEYAMDKQKYKLFLEYIDNMLQDPVISEYLIPKEKYRKFQSAYTAGVKPNYEILHEN